MINKDWKGRRFHALDIYLKNTYGKKLYKLPLSAKVSCPNRDGKVSTGGCIFCSEGGSGDFAGDARLSITEQIEEGKTKLSSKYSGSSYIAYFQSFTSTYAHIDYLREIFYEAINHPEVEILSIATRPDCLGADVLALLDELNHIKPVWVELGLQTSKKESIDLINRGYENSIYEKAISDLKAIGIHVISHIILGLPGESKSDMLASVKYATDLGTDGIKLQLLHILRNTPLGDAYLRQLDSIDAQSKEGDNLADMSTQTFLEKALIRILTEEEYIEILAACLEIIPQEVVIHRITGDGPKNLLIAPTWSGNKKKVLNNINHFLKENNTFQGKMV